MASAASTLTVAAVPRLSAVASVSVDGPGFEKTTEMAGSGLTGVPT